MQRSVKRLVPARPTDVGGIKVMRALPCRELRRVGSFVFLDHFDTEGRDTALQVGAHPHLGLQTATYLFRGNIRHQDSLGNDQVINPGDVNWMTAGSGIVHAEASSQPGPLHGIQAWVGLPHAFRKTEPLFTHFSNEILPLAKFDGAEVRIIAGKLTPHQGAPSSPVHTFQPLTYLDVTLDEGTQLTLNVDPTHELAVYACTNAVRVHEIEIPPCVLGHLSCGQEVLKIESSRAARAIIIGGTPLSDPTIVYWNFVVDSLDEGRAVEQDWEHGIFPKLP